MSSSYLGITTGFVIDVNDPQETGRVRAVVPSYGDRFDVSADSLPWISFVPPLAGSMNNSRFLRGTTEQPSPGPVSYGLWGIPKIGSTIVVSCLDGNPLNRIYLGCLPTERLSHTLPHGRFVFESGSTNLDGPLDSYDQPIQPTYDNLHTAFGQPSGNYEWNTRAADYSVSSNATSFGPADKISEVLDFSNVSVVSNDGKTFEYNNGYLNDELTGSSVYSWNTPGFHSISMDDRKENCRVKIRTTAGHQIILDDTNERIYVNTCEGRSWIELDQDGNIDVYSSTKINMRTEGDINLTAGQSIRFFANDSINLYSKETRIQTIQDINIHSGQTLKLQTDSDLLMKSSGTLQLKSSGMGTITSGETLNLKSSNNMLLAGSQIHLNGPTPSGDLNDIGVENAKWTNRLPSHEPFARCSTLNDFSHDPKYSYDDPNIGTEDKVRGPFWRR